MTTTQTSGARPLRWRRGATVAAALATAAVTAAGCGTAAGAGDKAGTPTVTLRLAVIDQLDPNGQTVAPTAFVDALGDLSGGRMTADVVTDYGDGAPGAESDLVRAIAAGELDGGFPSTRAFPRAGVGALDAVEAPMTITSYAAMADLVTSPVAGQLLDTLHGSGVVGLGLAVGSLRRPFASGTPLVGVDDWRGAAFRVYNSPVQSDVVTALGGKPVDASFDFIERVREGELRGGETDVFLYDHNQYGTEAGEVTGNVVLWPKVLVLSLSQRRFDALTPEQRGWVQEAARRAVQASVDHPYDETAAVGRMCARGVHFTDADPAQLAELRAAVRPVIDRMATDPRTAPTLAGVQAVAAAHPQPDAARPAGACTVSPPPDGAVPDAPADLPDGVYRTTVTGDDLEAAGRTNAEGPKGTWTLTVRDGDYQLTCRPVDEPGQDCGTEVTDEVLEAGHLRGPGGTAYFVPDPELLSRLNGCQLPPSETRPGACFPGFVYRMDWSLTGDQLRFSNYVADRGNPQYLLTPWQEIG